MIEVIDPSRCTGCNICVTVCPTRVFERVADALPIIARQDDCQTCFMCELYCPVDALYVAPLAEAVQYADADGAQAPAVALLGSYRAALGWQKGQQSTASTDASFELLGRAR